MWDYADEEINALGNVFPGILIIIIVICHEKNSEPSKPCSQKIFVLGVGGYVIKHNNMRARDIDLFRNDGICTYLILESMCT